MNESEGAAVPIPDQIKVVAVGLGLLPLSSHPMFRWLSREQIEALYPRKPAPEIGEITVPLTLTCDSREQRHPIPAPRSRFIPSKKSQPWSRRPR